MSDKRVMIRWEVDFLNMIKRSRIENLMGVSATHTEGFGRPALCAGNRGFLGRQIVPIYDNESTSRAEGSIRLLG